MRIIIVVISAMLFATPIAAEGAQITVNADTLLRTAYCLGAGQAQLAEAKELLPPLPPKPNMDKKDIELSSSIQKTIDGLKAEDAKLGKFRAYLMSFLSDGSLSANLVRLLVAATTSGQQDVDECRKLHDSFISECIAAHGVKECAKQALEQVKGEDEPAVCKKVASCNEFDIPF